MVLHERIEEIKKFIKENLRIHFSLSYDKNTDILKTRRGLQHFLSLRFDDQEKQNFYEIIISHAIKAEKSCPGAGIDLLKRFCNDKQKNDHRILSKSDLIRSLMMSGISKKNISLLNSVIEHASSTTKISLKRSTTNYSYIEITNGYTFDVSCMIPITSRVDLKNPKTVIVDGYIENISEIHHLLEDLSEKKEPCLLFCRGMSNDVLNTIKVNNDRKTIILYPVQIPYDIENVNSLVDIAVISDTDVISSLKGDLISSIKFSNLSSLESCSIFKNKIILHNKNSRDRVANHINQLKIKIKEREEISDILSKRVKSLSSSCIEISLSNDINFYSNSQQIDEGIRIISSVMNNSYIVDEISEYHNKELKKTLMECIYVK